MFVINSAVILEAIPENALAKKDTKNLDMAGSQEKILGVWWDVTNDNFTFQIRSLKLPDDVVEQRKLPTRRQALSVLMSVYDPLGLAAPFTVKGKIMMQQLCPPPQGEKWDDEIPETSKANWVNWLKQFPRLHQIQVPRCYADVEFRIRNAKCELHVFSDGSQEAWAAVAYLRFVLTDKVHVAFVMAKSKVVPRKKGNYTIPRIELEGVVLGARLATQIKKNIGLEIHEQFHWTDSTTVLQWVNKDPSQFQQFVANRVRQVQEEINPTWLHWIPGTENPADDLTRLAGNCEFGPNNRFHHSASFLWDTDDSNWPKLATSEREYNELVGLLMLTAKQQEALGAEELFQKERFSQWNRLVNTTVIVLKFIKKIPFEKSTKNTVEAVNILIRLSQQRCFSAELASLKTGKPIDNKSKLRKLSPMVDETGLLRHHGRIDNMPGATEEFKKPIVLDSADWMVQLLLEWYHRTLRHNGVLYTISEIRQKYYVIGAKRALWKIQSRCVFCQIRSVKPRPPEMGQLPRERLESYIPPFTHTGLDFFGPMEVKIGRSRVKRYGAIFTCFSTRAVHLELCDSLTADSCIMALRRFMSRRGTPKTIFSDNGTNFHGANNELAVSIKEVEDQQMKEFAESRGVEWKFNPPASPHMGGPWERLVRTVKTALKKTLSSTVPTPELLGTVLIEVENIVNSRPLCVISDDDVMLTPNHLLLQRSSTLLPPGQFNEKDLLLKKQWRASQYMADVFWKAWLKYYAPILSQRPKWWDKQREAEVGDLVVVPGEREERNTWVRGRITKVYKGKDNTVRVVDVQTKQGTYTRPVTKIGFLSFRRMVCKKIKQTYYIGLPWFLRVTGNQGSIPEREPEKRLPHLRKAAGARFPGTKLLGSGGSMVAKLKLKGIDGRAPPGVEPAA
uniref:Putative pao retrotransposon peptidase n=1 Tax=Lutzomyia longipalpis TaxID=7200 RepID=A0A1B0CTR4_LUTLO